MPSALPESPAVGAFLANLRKSGLIEPAQLDQYLAEFSSGPSAEAFPLAKRLVRGGVLTPFQAGHLLKGRNQGFLVGEKYKVLDLLGVGGMGAVYLVEHLRLRCLYAMKILPRERLKDPAALARFYREARATAAINHPNIVRTHDVDQERNLHYLVMEYVDGCDLQHVLDANGALDVSAAAHLISQTAAGLQEIHDAGWVHRDVKPSNILVNRDGVVKILDLGLARFFEDAKSITQQYEGAVLGTADYLAPELVADNNIVNIRSDIYSLGVVLYYLLAGQTPFGKGGSVAQKLMWANLREPDPIKPIRPELPDELVAVIMRMLAKNPEHRFQFPSEVVGALAPWTQEPFVIPSDKWLPAPNAAAVAHANRTGGSKPLNGTTPHPRYDATPRPSARSRPGSSGGSRPQTGSGPQPRPSRLREWCARGLRSRTRVAVLAATVAAAACGIGWAALGGGPPKDAPKDAAGAKPPGPPDFSQIMGSPPSGNPPIYASGGNGVLEKAVERAKPGDWVVVTGSKVEGTLEIDGTKFGREVTIIGAAGANGPTVWRPHPSARPDAPLIRISGVERLVIENLILDGAAQLHHLVEVRGRCPGLRLTKLQMRGFQKRAVVFDGGGGEADDEIVLDRLRVSVDPAVGLAEAAVAFRPGTAANQHVRVTDCRFDGGFAAGVALEGPATYLSFQRNRFYRCREGFRLADGADRVRLTAEGNTLFESERGLRLERLPNRDEGNRLLFRNNLFVRTPVIVRAQGGDELTRLFVGSVGNVHDPDSGREGGTLVSARSVAFPPLPTDPADDDRFLRYPGDHVLATAGTNRQPAGVPPR